MQYQLTCEQVGALMAFYIEDKLSEKLSKYVEQHLEVCPACREKYETMKKIIKKYAAIQRNINKEQNAENQSIYITKQYEEFKSNLSAYIDNELDDDENIKIKKITISNPLARKDLEEMYTFKRLLHNSFEKTKNDSKEDYTKCIMNKLQNDNANCYEKEPIFGIIAIFSALIICIVAGIIGILYL